LRTERRIAVAGLNPHAGESGAFGREDIEEIKPAIETALSNGIDVNGPLPPDTIFLDVLKGRYDAVVCMYHDQGHIPMKVLDFEGGITSLLVCRSSALPSTTGPRSTSPIAGSPLPAASVMPAS
jgi:4-hydroxythreonine-4-phosphate dehydrogenase